jgi:hypothetical protein
MGEWCRYCVWLRFVPFERDRAAAGTAASPDACANAGPDACAIAGPDARANAGPDACTAGGTDSCANGSADACTAGGTDSCTNGSANSGTDGCADACANGGTGARAFSNRYVAAKRPERLCCHCQRRDRRSPVGRAHSLSDRELHH